LLYLNKLNTFYFNKKNGHQLSRAYYEKTSIPKMCCISKKVGNV